MSNNISNNISWLLRGPSLGVLAFILWLDNRTIELAIGYFAVFNDEYQQLANPGECCPILVNPVYK